MSGRGLQPKDEPIHFEVGSEKEILALRQFVREFAGKYGLGLASKSRVVMCVTELAENAVKHAGGGSCQIMISELPELGEALMIRVDDRGKGIRYLSHVLGDRLDSDIDLLGCGLVGVRRVADYFEIDSNHLGTRVCLGFALPKSGEP